MNNFLRTLAVRKNFFSRILMAAFFIASAFKPFAQTPVPMATQPGLSFTETFADIANWTNNFASGSGAEHWGSVAVNTSGTIPDGVKTTVSTATFVSSSSGGVQRGTGSIVLLSTGTTDNSSACAIDIFLDYTGVTAGTVSFNWAALANGTGDRASSLKVYGSTDGVTFTEISGAEVSNVANNSGANGTVSLVSLPSSFNNSATARLRFYEFNGTGGTTGSRAKISIDSLIVTAVSSKQDQTITFNALPVKKITDADFALTATASSGLKVTYKSNNTAVATIVNGNKIHIVGATGNALITASQAGNNQYNPAPDVSQNLLVIDPSKQNQTITFNAIPAKKYGGADFNLAATASSGLTVTYTSSNPSVASVSGKVVTIHNIGTTVITAMQSGNATYNPAANVTQTLTINPKALTVAGAAGDDKEYDGTVAATISGTLNGLVGSDTVLFTGTGTFADANVGTNKPVTSTSTISGPQANRYTLTQPTGLTANITKASQTISFSALPQKVAGDPNFKLTASASSHLPVSYKSSNTSVATIVGDTAVHIVTAGSAVITASQAGNANYDTASPVQQTLTVISAIAKWNFDSITTSNTGTDVVISVGNGVADAGEHKAGSLFTAVHSSSATTWSNPAGNGSAKSVSANNWNVNDYFQFKVDKTGYNDIIVKWDQNSSSTGPGSFKLQYSTNGTTFTDFSNVTIPSGVSWSSNSVNAATSFTADLSSLTKVDTAKIIYFRVTDSSTRSVTGDTVASGGSGRIDNFTVTGTKTTSDSCAAPTGLKAIVVSATTAKLKAKVNAGAIKYKVEYRPVGTSTYTFKSLDTPYFVIKGLTAATTYEWAMASICKSNPLVQSAYKKGKNFTTTTFSNLVADDQTLKNTNTILSASVYPNPATTNARISLSNNTNGVAIKLTDLTGKLIWQAQNVKGSTTDIPLANVAKGIYVVTVTDGKTTQQIKVVKE